mmetsp:Transcript_28039/g.64468  ORF Transcript_28039/g.64468 Transcript_28039/m.64468 type:complete len:215 (-) Transcript_28039:4538-5182(-)
MDQEMHRFFLTWSLLNKSRPPSLMVNSLAGKELACLPLLLPSDLIRIIRDLDKVDLKKGMHGVMHDILSRLSATDLDGLMSSVNDALSCSRLPDNDWGLVAMQAAIKVVRDAAVGYLKTAIHRLPPQSSMSGLVLLADVSAHEQLSGQMPSLGAQATDFTMQDDLLLPSSLALPCLYYDMSSILNSGYGLFTSEKVVCGTVLGLHSLWLERVGR